MAWKYADELIRDYKHDLASAIFLKQQLINKRFKANDTCLNAKDYAIFASAEAVVKCCDQQIKLINQIVSSTRYSIQWLETGREPGNRREITRQSVYQRTVCFDNLDVPAFNQFRIDSHLLSEEEHGRLEKLLDILSLREREAIQSVVGRQNTFAETADYLGISRSSVQVYVNRGMRKLHDSLSVIQLPTISERDK